MKFKIVSGGQTGVDCAGLEAAIALGLRRGGFAAERIPSLYTPSEIWYTPK